MTLISCALVLTLCQQRTLRIFKHESVFLATFDEDRTRDPKRISTMDISDSREDNLFPSLLGGPLEGSSSALEASRVKRYGYPICWSRQGYEWYPYLPAVTKFHYPIFNGLSYSPDIIHDGHGYRLKPEEVTLWQNIEYTLLAVSAALSPGQLTSLNYHEPEPPSAFGYARSHSQLKFAKKCVIKSLNAFQRLLGYCSYIAAESEPFETNRAQFYSDAWVSDLYHKLEPRRQQELHITTKRLLYTLWDVRKSRNFTGVVVGYDKEYDYPAVRRMEAYGVPVYVAWPNPESNPYIPFYQHHLLAHFLPPAELFRDLEAVPAARTSVVRYGIPPAPKDSATYDHPMDYVRLRFEKIPAELENHPHKQSMMDRLASARKSASLGSAQFYEFDQVTVPNKQTGQQRERWTRALLTKHQAKEWFEYAEGRHLW